MSDTDHLLVLSTRVAPTQKFLVDGEEYELLGMDHLSEDDEALVMARFSKYQQTADNLSIESDLRKGQALASSLKKQRTAIIAQLTTLPKEIAAKLPTKPAVKIIEAVQTVLEEGDGDDDPSDTKTEDDT